MDSSEKTNSLARKAGTTGSLTSDILVVGEWIVISAGMFLGRIFFRSRFDEFDVKLSTVADWSLSLSACLIVSILAIGLSAILLGLPHGKSRSLFRLILLLFGILWVIAYLLGVLVPLGSLLLELDVVTN